MLRPHGEPPSRRRQPATKGLSPHLLQASSPRPTYHRDAGDDLDQTIVLMLNQGLQVLFTPELDHSLCIIFLQMFRKFIHCGLYHIPLIHCKYENSCPPSQRRIRQHHRRPPTIHVRLSFQLFHMDQKESNRGNPDTLPPRKAV